MSACLSVMLIANPIAFLLQSIREGAQVEAGTFSTTLSRCGEQEAATPGSVELLVTAEQKAAATLPSPPSPLSPAEDLSR